MPDTGPAHTPTPAPPAPPFLKLWFDLRFHWPHPSAWSLVGPAATWVLSPLPVRPGERRGEPRHRSSGTGRRLNGVTHRQVLVFSETPGAMMKTPAPETLRSGGGGRNDSSLPVTASDQRPAAQQHIAGRAELPAPQAAHEEQDSEETILGSWCCFLRNAAGPAPGGVPRARHLPPVTQAGRRGALAGPPRTSLKQESWETGDTHR